MYHVRIGCYEVTKFRQPPREYRLPRLCAHLDIALLLVVDRGIVFAAKCRALHVTTKVPG